MTQTNLANAKALNAAQTESLRKLLSAKTRTNRSFFNGLSLADIQEKVSEGFKRRLVVEGDEVVYQAGQHYPSELSAIRKQLLK